jgi:hypothetical protein
MLDFSDLKELQRKEIKASWNARSRTLDCFPFKLVRANRFEPLYGRIFQAAE